MTLYKSENISNFSWVPIQYIDVTASGRVACKWLWVAWLLPMICHSADFIKKTTKENLLAESHSKAVFFWKFLVRKIKLNINWKLIMFSLQHLFIHQKFSFHPQIISNIDWQNLRATADTNVIGSKPVLNCFTSRGWDSRSSIAFGSCSY